jgi:hypothetical protein
MPGQTIHINGGAAADDRPRACWHALPRILRGQHPQPAHAPRPRRCSALPSRNRCSRGPTKSSNEAVDERPVLSSSSIGDQVKTIGIVDDGRAPPEGQVRTGLTAGGEWIQTVSSAMPRNRQQRWRLHSVVNDGSSRADGRPAPTRLVVSVARQLGSGDSLCSRIMLPHSSRAGPEKGALDPLG